MTLKLKRLMAGILAGVMTTTAIPFSASAATDTKTYTAKENKTTGAQEIVVRAKKDGYLLFDWDAVSAEASGMVSYPSGFGTINYSTKVTKDNSTNAVEFSDNLVSVLARFVEENGLTEDEGKSIGLSLRELLTAAPMEDATFDEAVAAYKNNQLDTPSSPLPTTTVNEAIVSDEDKLAIFSALSIVVVAYLFDEASVSEDASPEEIEQAKDLYGKVAKNGATLAYDDFVSMVGIAQQHYLGEGKAISDKEALQEALNASGMTLAFSLLGLSMTKNTASYMVLPVKANEVVNFSVTPNTEQDKFKLTCETDVDIIPLEYLSSNSSDILLKKGQSLVLSAKKGTKFSSSNKNVVTVSSSGKITAKKAGTAIITAKVGTTTYKYRVKVSDKTATGDMGIVKKADTTVTPVDLKSFGVLDDSFHGTMQYDILTGYANEYDVSKIKISDLKEIKANTKITQKGDKIAKPTLGTFTLAEKSKVTLEVEVPNGSVDFTANAGITNAEDFGGAISLRLNEINKWYEMAKAGDVYKVTKTFELPAGTYYAGVVGNCGDVTYTIKSSKAFASTNKTSMPAFTLSKGKTMNLDGNGTDIRYYSSNTKVAKISNKGVVTAVAKGTTYITVQSDTNIVTYKITVN